VDEMYKMLGREHQADLDREASKHALASSLPSRPGLRQRAVAWLRQLATLRTAAANAKVGDSAQPQPVEVTSPEQS
jgi:hypothetical protein